MGRYSCCSGSGCVHGRQHFDAGRFARCESIGGARQGGAVALDGWIEVEDSVFIANRAGGGSGPALVQGAAIDGRGVVTIRRRRFEANVLAAASPVLGARGAAIRGQTVTIEDAHFERNGFTPEKRPFAGIVNCSNAYILRRVSFTDQPGPNVFAPRLNLENVSFVGPAVKRPWSPRVCRRSRSRPRSSCAMSASLPPRV